MDAGQAYARAYDLLARVGLRERADAYPGSMSGGEQRRVAIARALINSPPLLLADEPTSDLDEDTETDIIDLLEQLQRTESFGFVLVTHNLELAKRARRTYEMRQGVLAATDLPQVEVDPERPRRFGPAAVDAPAELALSAAVVAPIRLGSSLWRGVQIFLLAGAVIFGGILLADFAVDKYQKMRVREREARSLALQHLALNSLRGDVQSVTDLGDGRYELTTYLQNVGGGPPIYVMSPDLRAYVQVKTVWQEVPMKPSRTARAACSGSRASRPIAICSTHACGTTRNCCLIICMCAFPARCWSVPAARRATTYSSARTIITSTSSRSTSPTRWC
jgi:putative ABC transport system ATP-binding protein/macrolide transport system ATP-binding/permease protein/lipoprotein-releasing system ATP-binding protein